MEVFVVGSSLFMAYFIRLLHLIRYDCCDRVDQVNSIKRLTKPTGGINLSLSTCFVVLLMCFSLLLYCCIYLLFTFSISVSMSISDSDDDDDDSDDDDIGGLYLFLWLFFWLMML